MDINPANSASTKPVKKEFWLKRAAKKVGSTISKGVNNALDEFVPRRRYTSVDIDHKSPEYKNISKEDGAKMMNYFVQKMEKQGFPWELFKPKKGLVKMTELGEFEALNRLRNDEPVIFQPKRVIGLGFNPPALKGKDITGAEVKSKMDIKTGGMEVKHGEPVEIKNFGDLKLLYELYNPDIKIDPEKGSEITRAAKDLSFFTKGTMATQYPWKMFKPQTAGQKILSSAKAAVKSGSKWAAIGTGIGYLLKLSSVVVGLGSLGPLGMIGAGMALGAGYGIIKGAKSKRHGQEINAFESLSRLNKNEPVYFQEMKKKEIGISVPFPVNIQLGSLSYFREHGKGSTVKNLDELELFNQIQEEEKPQQK